MYIVVFKNISSVEVNLLKMLFSLFYISLAEAINKITILYIVTDLSINCDQSSIVQQYQILF